MCPDAEWDQTHNRTATKLFNKLALEIAEYSDLIEKITIQPDGEPLIDINLEMKINCLKKIEIKNVAFSSYASIMTEKQASTVIDSGINGVVSWINANWEEIKNLTLDYIHKP